MTLAHRGVLFLDELGEFPPHALEALRQPLEDRVVRISRQPFSITFPADFQLVACSNPCPCGLGPPRCTCSDIQQTRYRRRLSAPLLDRFDLRLDVRPPEPSAVRGEPSAFVRNVCSPRRHARGSASADCGGTGTRTSQPARSRPVALDPDASDAWRSCIDDRGLTGRGAARIRRVARTLADLDDVPEVGAMHVTLAALLREDVP